MHTVHLANYGDESRRRLAEEGESTDTKIWASALGIIFDRENYDPSVTADEIAVIDKFFDQLNFEKSAPSAVLNENTDVNFGDLMSLVDLSSRWAYVGSLTTPPCTVGVYF
jgi:hypothetical protein